MTTETAPRKPRAKKPAEAAPEKDTKTGDLLADVAPQPSSALAVLPPAERAAVAIKSESAEQNLRALMKKSADIKEVKDAAGREQVHRMAMDLKNARVAIKNAGEAAREDANAFSRAVVAEVARLAAISKEEEDRVFKLRDDFDAEQERIKAEVARKEEERVAAIRAKISAITALAQQHANSDSATLTEVVKELAAREVTKEEFAELSDEAELAMKATADALLVLRDAAIKTEQEKQRIADEAAENKRKAALLEAKQKEVADAAAALKLAQEQQKRTMDAAKFFNDFAATPGNARVLDEILQDARRSEVDGAETFGAGADMVKMARDMAIKTLEQRYAQAVAEELPAAHAEALELNAQFDALHAHPLPGGQRYSKTTFRGDGKPILLNADGSRSVFCDLDEGCGDAPEAAPAPAVEPAPEPAPLPLPEAYSPVDELIDMAPSDGPTDDEIMELIECEYGWTRNLTIRRLQVVIANQAALAAA